MEKAFKSGMKVRAEGVVFVWSHFVCERFEVEGESRFLANDVR